MYSIFLLIITRYLNIIMLKYFFAWLLVHFLLSEGNSLLMVMLLVTSMVQLYFKYSEFCFSGLWGKVSLSLFLSILKMLTPLWFSNCFHAAPQGSQLRTGPCGCGSILTPWWLQILLIQEPTQQVCLSCHFWRRQRYVSCVDSNGWQKPFFFFFF